MALKDLLALSLLLWMASAASGSTLLARMEADKYIGYSVPPLHTSANFAFAVSAPGSPPIQETWQIGSLSPADVGRTISLTRDTASDYPTLDWSLLVDGLTNGEADIVYHGLGRPTGPVTHFSGLAQSQIFGGFNMPSFIAEAFVPSLTGYDFGGYRFDRFDFVLHSLGFRHEAGYYWIDAHYEIKMFGGVALAGDFNGDAVVDGGDFLVWQRGGSPHALSVGDLELWKTAMNSQAAAEALAVVPEPTLGLLATTLLSCAATRLRRVGSKSVR